MTLLRLAFTLVAVGAGWIPTAISSPVQSPFQIVPNGEISKSATTSSSPVSHPHQPSYANDSIGEFSQWSKRVKNDFLADLRNNSAEDWIVVMGNEGGDLDSMASALALAWHFDHAESKKAVALLQTAEDALHLRPENVEALRSAGMSSGHRDLLTIDELPIKPNEIGHRIRGIALVDHNVPRAIWSTSHVLAIVDHHVDRNLSVDVSPRLIQNSASCSSLVTKILLEGGKIPIELADLLLRTIALDSKGLSGSKTLEQDERSARDLVKLSSFKSDRLREIMDALSSEMLEKKIALERLTVRDLLRRDYKGDPIPTLSLRYPQISLGFASTSVSLLEQIQRTPESTVPEFFAIERAFASEIGADVTVSLNSYRSATGDRVREIILIVASGHFKRIHEAAATELFECISDALTSNLELKEWNRPDGKPLLTRRAVWTHSTSGAGRKLIRPIVENAVRGWSSS